MALSKRTIIGSINITELGSIEVREDTIISDGAEEVTRTYHRYVLEPGDDLGKQPENVATHALAAWTPEVVKAFAVVKASRK